MTFKRIGKINKTQNNQNENEEAEDQARRYGGIKHGIKGV